MSWKLMEHHGMLRNFPMEPHGTLRNPAETGRTVQNIVECSGVYQMEVYGKLWNVMEHCRSVEHSVVFLPVKVYKDPTHTSKVKKGTPPYHSSPFSNSPFSSPLRYIPSPFIQFTSLLPLHPLYPLLILLCVVEILAYL